jgi:hypothetical protein
MRTAFAAYARDHEAASIRRCWSSWNVLCTFLYTGEQRTPTPMQLVGRPSWLSPSTRPSPAPQLKHCWKPSRWTGNRGTKPTSGSPIRLLAGPGLDQSAGVTQLAGRLERDGLGVGSSILTMGVEHWSISPMTVWHLWLNFVRRHAIT